MTNIQQQIEALLFTSIKPLSYKVLADMVGVSKEEVQAIVEAIQVKYQAPESGVVLAVLGEKVQMTTAPEVHGVIATFLKDETTGDLTPASLETLTVIAYRGPVSKTEIEMIRGVNCSLILKNLLMRGFIEEIKDEHGLLSLYQVTFDFLRYLGIKNPQELPNYETLHAHEQIESLIAPEVIQENQKEEVSDTSLLD